MEGVLKGRIVPSLLLGFQACFFGRRSGIMPIFINQTLLHKVEVGLKYLLFEFF